MYFCIEIYQRNICVMKNIICLLFALLFMPSVCAQYMMRIHYQDKSYQDFDVNAIDSITWFRYEYASFEVANKVLSVGDTYTQVVTTNSNGNVTYASSNPSVATVDESSGMVTAVANGDVIITATIAPTATFNALSAEYTIIVEGGLPNDESEVAVTGGYDDIYISKAKLTAFANIPEDVSLFQIGIYCSTDENPNNSNGQTIIANNANNSESEYYFQVNNLEMNTRYYYKAYVYIPATATYYYGEIRSFITENILKVTSGEAIDLGLSVKWCSHNLGASNPEGFGEEYAWGELTPYSGSYAYYSNGSYIDIGNNICGTGYDVAKAVLGENWKLPTYAQLSELFNCCAFAKTEYNGVPGLIVEGMNRNSIFIPYGITNIYSGYHTDPSGNTNHYYGDFSGFMTGVLSTSSGNRGRVYSLMFDYNKGLNYIWYTGGTLERMNPQAVRPVTP